MTDLVRLDLAFVGVAVAIVAAGVLLGLIEAWLKRGRRWRKLRTMAEAVDDLAVVLLALLLAIAVVLLIAILGAR
jgi:hypothetical protein